MRGEWIEIQCLASSYLPCPSLPMRGEWIEIRISHYFFELFDVSPHAGRVD